MNGKPQRQYRRNRGGVKRTQNQQRVNNAPISRSKAITGSAQNNYLRKVGDDYIQLVEGPNFADGVTLFAFRIDPASLPQMAGVAKTYQKVHYNRLKFTLASHMPTTATGGYIMCFVPDPDDELPSDILEKKRRATSNPNSIRANIWDTRTLTITAGNGRSPTQCLPQRQFYTSPSVEAREYSPGVFYVVVDGAVNQAGSLSLSVQWDVTFHVQSYENEVSVGLEQDIDTKIDLYCYDGESTSRVGDTASTAYMTWKNTFEADYPGNGYIYRCEVPVRARPQDVSSSDTTYAVYWRTSDVTEGDGRLDLMASKNTPIEVSLFLASGTGENTQVIPNGTTFSLVRAGTPTNYQRRPRLTLGRTPFYSLPGGGISNIRTVLKLSKR